MCVCFTKRSRRHKVIKNCLSSTVGGLSTRSTDETRERNTRVIIERRGQNIPTGSNTVCDSSLKFRGPVCRVANEPQNDHKTAGADKFRFVIVHRGPPSRDPSTYSV